MIFISVHNSMPENAAFTFLFDSQSLISHYLHKSENFLQDPSHDARHKRNYFSQTTHLFDYFKQSD